MEHFVHVTQGDLNNRNEKKQCLLLEGMHPIPTPSMPAWGRVTCKVKNSYTWIFVYVSDQLIMSYVSFWLKRKFLTSSESDTLYMFTGGLPSI